MKKLLLLISLLLAVGCTSEYSSKEECLLREQQKCPNGNSECNGSTYAFCDEWEGNHFTNAYKEEYRAQRVLREAIETEKRKSYCEGTCKGVDCMFISSTNNKYTHAMSEEEIKKMCD